MGWSDRSVRIKGLIVVVVPFMALLAALGLHLVAARQAQAAAQDVEHTLVVLRHQDRVLELTLNTDGRVRTFALTRDPSELDLPRAATTQLTPAVEHLAVLVAANPQQAELVERLHPLIDQRLTLARQRRARVEAGLPDDPELFLQAQELNAAMRHRVGEMQQLAEGQLDDRRNASAEAARILTRANYLVIAAGLGGSVLVAALYWRAVARRLSALADDAATLTDEPTKQRRTDRDEIGRAGAALREARRQVHERRTRDQQIARDLQATSDAKSRFLSHMSHELRTPLNAVLGFAQILDLSDLDTSDRESVKQIHRAGEHLLGLINEILDLSRIEAGQFPLSLEPVPVREALTDALTLMGPTAADHHITLINNHCDDAESSPLILADRQRLKQILLNLIANAIKYNRPNGSVTLACSQPTTGTVRITVTDTGPGISDKNMKLLFEPFERLDAERSSTEGAGLGLALSRNLAQLMNGHLAADSRLGTGTTFWLELPTAPEPRTIDLAHTTTTDLTLKELDDLDQPLPAELTVLHIEDNGATAELVRSVLARHTGTTLLNANTGRAGIESARHNHPHLILLDLHLPDLDGHDVLHTLKHDPTTAAIPIIVISADATPGTIRRTLERGANDFLTKPLDIHHLLRATHTAITPTTSDQE